MIPSHGSTLFRGIFLSLFCGIFKKVLKMTVHCGIIFVLKNIREKTNEKV